MAVIFGTNSPADDDPAGTPLIGYDDIVTTANVTSTTEVVGFPITNVANPATHLVWKGGVNTGSEIITIINSLAATLDYLAIAGHNLGSKAILVTITDNSSPPVTLVAETQLLDDKPTIFRFAPGNYGAIQLSLNLSFATDDFSFPQIAVIYCGHLLVLERGIKVDVSHVPLIFGRRTTVVNGMSESGNFLGRIVLSETRQTKAEFFGFNQTFYRASIDPFLAAAQENPFFWAWAPKDYPLDTGYAWLTSNSEPEVSPDHRRIALTLNLAGIA